MAKLPKVCFYTPKYNTNSLGRPVKLGHLIMVMSFLARPKLVPRDNAASHGNAQVFLALRFGFCGMK